VPALAAFLRGVNLGPSRRLPMAELRTALEEAGFEGARTILQSGNIVVRSSKSAAAVEREIEAVVQERFGLRSDVLVRTEKQLADIVDGDPYDGNADHGSRYFVMFLPKKPSKAALGPFEDGDWGIDSFKVKGRELYIWCPEGMRDSRLIKELHKPGRIADTFTMRNWNTVTKTLAVAREL
jgi:uncharacterized protein (DUF1697 family)